MNIKINMLIVSLLIVLLAPTTSSAQGFKGREVLGIRLGGIVTQGGLKDEFGKGSEIELYFIEGLGSWFGVDIAFSSHNLGESLDREKNIEYLGYDREIKLNIYSATVAFVALGNIKKRLIPSLEAGGGLYSITAIIPAGFYEGHITDNQPGIYAGAALDYRITKNLMAGASFKCHYIFSGSDDAHTTYFFTEEKRSVIYQITVGITIFTG